jgi:hypothetical protein
MPSTIGVVASSQNFPLSLNPALWLDAADTTTIAASSGSVSQWNDKSGNGYHVTQGSGTKQPTTNSQTINSLNVLSFDGSNDSMTNTAVPSIAQPYTYVVVAKESSAITVTKSLLNAVGGSNIVALFLGGTSPNRRINVFTNTSSVVNGPTLNTTNTNIYFMSGNGASSLLGIEGALNTVTINGTRASGFQIGTNATDLGEFFNGLIAEIVYFNRTLTANERTNLFDYLKIKWGI